MKTSIQITSVVAMLACLWGSPPVWAQNPVPRPPFEARIFVSQANPYLRDTFTIRLEIVTRDVDIDQGLNLIQLPDPSRLSILTPFQPLAVNRDTIDGVEITRRRYRAQARAHQPGKIELSPSLQVKVRKRVRTMFGSAVQEIPVTQPVEPVAIHVRPLPQPQPDDFAGIIGDFDIKIEATPLTIAEGDLVTITTTIKGQGWVDPERITAVAPAPQLRTYPVQTVSSGPKQSEHTFTQTVIPLDQTLHAIPAWQFSWFNTQTETYEHVVAGPFSLEYREPETRIIHSAPDTATTTEPGTGPQAAGPTVYALTPARLAPASSSLITFRIPGATAVHVLMQTNDWALIEAPPNRGWIPAAALAPPTP